MHYGLAYKALKYIFNSEQYQKKQRPQLMQ